ncbi:hypothetical protein T492DRAFT_856145 [Pavlovales sp. CCMP2436]|nr:hypothetical protein T492DRAFT_856145 [Pavlovales sp. CCMP2436]
MPVKGLQLLEEGGDEFSRSDISDAEEPAAALHPDERLDRLDEQRGRAGRAQPQLAIGGEGVEAVAKPAKPVDLETPLSSPLLAFTPVDVAFVEVDLAGPLPPLPAQSLHPPPLRRLGSALLEDRRVAREHILKASPVLLFTESWWQTLLSASEYTQIGFISLLIVFRTSQAYARWSPQVLSVE